MAGARRLISHIMGILQKSLRDISPFRRDLGVVPETSGSSDDDTDSLSISIKYLESNVEVQRLGRAHIERVYLLYPNLEGKYNEQLRAAVRSGQLDRVKSLLDLGAEVREPDAEGRVPLHIAARNGSYDLTAKLLERHTGVDVDIRDKEGKTPLYYAVADASPDVVALLLKKGANPNIVAKPRHTILSLLLGEESCQETANTLLGSGASPLFSIDRGVLDLITAAASGRTTIVLKLLTEGVNVNGQDGFGYNALYEASRFGHLEVVKLLIAAGAKPNSRTGLSGDTALHGIIDKGRKCRQLLLQFEKDLEIRTESPILCSKHLDIVRVLLQYGTLSEARRWDGLTSSELISKILDNGPIVGDEGVTLSDAEKLIIKELQGIIENPPGVYRKSPRSFPPKWSLLPGKWCPLPQQLNDEELEVCKYFKVRTHHQYTDYFQARYSTVNEFIYNRQNKKSKRWTEFDDSESTTQSLGDHQSQEDGQCWRWIHLPANNKRWVKDLIRVLFREKGCNSSKIRNLEAFIDESYQEFRGSSSYARYRKPSFDKQEDGDSCIYSLVAPYFDMETEAFLTRREENDDKHVQMMQQLVDSYQHGGTSVEDLHLACTLDQSYYTSLIDSSDRDRDQVAFRFHSRRQDPVSQRDDSGTTSDSMIEPHNKPIQPTRPQHMKKRLAKLVMVSQLWLWKIDQDIIITALPERWHGGYEKDILGHILGNISDSPSSSLDQMIENILQSCIGFVDAPSNAGLDENLFDIFEQSIAKVANNETIRYKKFCEHQQQCAKMSLKIRKGKKISPRELESFRDTEDLICDITEEVKHLEEIKDIRDELRMIQRVLEDQRAVLEKYRSEGHRSLGPDEPTSLSFRQNKARRLYSEAESVENSLKNLLDLKQKQGNLNEARDTRKLADEADKRALADKTQSKLLFIFTFVTVIYTPLAFISALFAVPSSDFPRDSDGVGAGWRWWQIIAGSFVAEIVTSLAILGYWRGLQYGEDNGSKRSGGRTIKYAAPEARPLKGYELDMEKRTPAHMV